MSDPIVRGLEKPNYRQLCDDANRESKQGFLIGGTVFAGCYAAEQVIESQAAGMQYTEVLSDGVFTIGALTSLAIMGAALATSCRMRKEQS